MDGSAFPFWLVTGHSASLFVNLPAQLELVACDFVTLFLGSLVAFAIEPILSICSQIGLCSRPVLLLICWPPWGSSSEIILLTLSGWVEKQRAAEERTRAAQKLLADDAAAGQQAEREARDAKGQAQADKRATEALDAKAAT